MLGETLKILRGNKTLQEVANAIGTTRVSLGYYEKEQRKPDSDTIRKICQYYNVSSDYILGISNHHTENEIIQCMIEKTGLSEDEITKLSKSKNEDGKLLEIIKAVIKSY